MSSGVPSRRAASAAWDAHARGTALLLEGHLPRAVEWLRRAVHAEPGLRDAHYNLAVALKAQGDLDGAVSHLHRALDLGPVLPQALALLGALLELRGQRREAMAHYGAALRVDPAHRVARYYLGMALRLEGRDAEAVEHLRGALAPSPRPPLPELVEQRILGQLHDTLAEAGPARGPIPGEQCGTALVSEVLPVRLLEGAPPPARGGVPINPGAGPDVSPPPSAQGVPFSPATEPDVSCSPPSRAAPSRLDVGSGDSSPPPVRTAPFRADVKPGVISSEDAARLLAQARSVVALTGAGISADSGLATRKELWRRYDKDSAVSVWRFREDPSVLWGVVRDFLGGREHAPNPAHEALARLPHLMAIATQNVDGLHQRAEPVGSQRPVVELHGTLLETRCHECGTPGEGPASAYVAEGAVLPPRCGACGGVLRPDVVLFGEWVAPARLARAAAWARACDVLLVVGCAMDVAPASELPRLAARHGAVVLEVKRRPSRLTQALPTHVVHGPAEEVLPAILDALPSELAPHRGGGAW